MSDSSIPRPPADFKAIVQETMARFPHATPSEIGYLSQHEYNQRTMPADLGVPTRRRPPRRQRRKTDADTYTPIEHTLYSVQTFGFTHPSSGRYLMVPKEFQAIMILETKAVAAVIWEIMQQTIGWEGNGPGGRREWAPLTLRYFVRARILSMSKAEEGIKQALAKGYIERRPLGARRFEYRLHWKGTN
jgi:hypothetical protein